jgi:hypothetical protein
MSSLAPYAPEDNTEALRFLEALGAVATPEERLIMCAFSGDPNTADSTAWRPRPWRSGEMLPVSPRQTNGYVTIASFARSLDGSWRRRTDKFHRGFALMVDDIGTGSSAKVSKSVVKGMQPSAIVETSPDNFQYWYFLDEPCTDKRKFDAVIKAFIAGNLMGKDTGMNGVNRVGRVPGFINGKEKYGGWRVRLVELTEQRYSLQQLIDGFGLKPEVRTPYYQKLNREEVTTRIEAFDVFYRWLHSHGMLKHFDPNRAGWTEIVCPWVDDHTDRANTGTGVSDPSPDNGHYGAFRCHHSHGEELSWSDLTDFIARCAEESLEAINDNPLDFSEYKP